jgi:hypothetical protein
LTSGLDPYRARIDRAPTTAISRPLASCTSLCPTQDAGRYGDRKGFIASLWTKMLDIEARTGGTLTDGATIEYFKAWLGCSRLLTCDLTKAASD